MALELENRGEMKLALKYVPQPTGGIYSLLLCLSLLGLWGFCFCLGGRLVVSSCITFFNKFRHLVLT